MQHRDSVMKHQNKESRNTDKAFPQQWVFKRMKSSESSKTQDSQSSKQNCAIQKHRDVNLTFKGLYITKKNEVTTNAKNPFNEACFQFARKAAFSSLFPAYC